MPNPKTPPQAAYRLLTPLKTADGVAPVGEVVTLSLSEGDELVAVGAAVAIDPQAASADDASPTDKEPRS